MQIQLSSGVKSWIVAGCIALTMGNAHAGNNWNQNNQDYQTMDSIIVMIPDGCDETVQTVARWYKGEDLAVDKMQTGAVKTHMANSIITGSAAAATAFATGHKTSVRFIGVGPRTEDLLSGLEPTAEPYAPVATILEAAQRAGKATGIISTSRVTHATPAAFAAHIQDRGWDNDIMEHMVYNNIDVVFGGGARHLIPAEESYTTSFGDTWKGKRTDGENLIQVLQERGYQFIDSKEQLNTVNSGKVWGMFDDSHMQPDMDRQYFAEHEPSLAEMVKKAIDILSQDPDGFLLMVEGSQVDWAGHNNDPIYMVRDFIAFDDAVKVANTFASEDGRTAVMAYPDHNTGGMKIGHYATAMGYTETTIENLVEPLKAMKTSANGVVKMMVDDSDEALVASVAEHWGIDLSPEDVAEIRDFQTAGLSLSYALARVASAQYTVIGWTTHGHTGETVPLWMYGEPTPGQVIDNTDLATIAADIIGVNLRKTTKKLYRDLDSVTTDYTIDFETDPDNPVLKVAGVELPLSKDYMVKKEYKRKNKKTVYKEKTIQLPGLTVYAPQTEKVYLSVRALKKLHLL